MYLQTARGQCAGMTGFKLRQFCWIRQLLANGSVLSRTVCNQQGYPVSDFLKVNFIAGPIFLFECFVQKKNMPKTILFSMTQKGKTVVNCTFLRSKTEILHNLWKNLRDRTVATVAPLRKSAPSSLFLKLSLV